LTAASPGQTARVREILARAQHQVAGDETADTMAAAITLLRRGFHVFPVDHPDHPQCLGLHGPNNPCDGVRGKHPACKWGTWATTVTEQMIELAWTSRGGLANIGVSCGPTNIVVLDEDQAGELERWCDAHGITLPPTYTVTTYQGKHLYFRWDHQPTRITNREAAFAGYKINVRGHGGFAVAEGSQHASGVVYTGNGAEIADLPDEVAALLLAGTNTDTDGVDTDTEGSQPDAHRGAGRSSSGANGEDFLRETADPNTTMIADGHRHPELVAYAGRLRNLGLDLTEALPTYRQRWLLCEQPDGQTPRLVSTAPAAATR
jgi:hypothetical protein